ncbi:MAG: hypothetical protein FJ320_09505 [SAR202 cluster bacterium]|nr:hypothetical protein [SAR202 cluster bacterium]
MVTKKPDEMMVVKGFRIEVSGPAGGKNEDKAWETATGGALCIEIGDSSTGSDRISTGEPTPKSVTEIVLRGPMTKSRKWIGQNINDTVKGKFARFDLSIIEIMKDGSDGKRYNYFDCFITRYVYPVLSADGKGNLYEEVHIKPIRLDLA